MKEAFLYLLLSALLALVPGVSSAADQDDALKSAEEILASLRNKQFEELWNSQTSEFFKKTTTKESFIANLTLSRHALGSAGESKLIDVAYTNTDSLTGLKGEIYAVNFLNVYTAGKFYERIVVVKEEDGTFRLSGLWIVPAEK